MNNFPAELAGQLCDPKLSVDGKASARNTVLIAEDDPLFRRILERWFQQWDYRVMAVENGLDAWEVLQREDAPQLAILDWMMPGMDGIELCRRIRSRDQSPYRYVLLLTAKDDKQDVITGLEAGADDYLTKPFDVDELRARVRAGKRILDLQAALIHAQDDLQSAALHDSLTGLWNRGAILDLLRREVCRRQRTGDALGVMMVDIDYFKKINDTHGHLIGDAVLQEVTRRLAVDVRPYDAVGRYGGEEFLIVFPGCNMPDLLVGAERLRHCIADQPIETSVGQIPVTLSLGLASVEQGENEILGCESFLQRADAALYAAKARGRNRVETAAASTAVGQQF
ncbi:MAG TPA: diguanylate cyclase [Candidatus Acidoferrales bacterium]|nr:diguanylate cyclase [Candidatus Acidoferrales bacterium]